MSMRRHVMRAYKKLLVSRLSGDNLETREAAYKKIVCSYASMLQGRSSRMCWLGCFTEDDLGTAVIKFYDCHHEFSHDGHGLFDILLSKFPVKVAADIERQYKNIVWGNPPRHMKPTP